MLIFNFHHKEAFFLSMQQFDLKITNAIFKKNDFFVQNPREGFLHTKNALTTQKKLRNFLFFFNIILGKLHTKNDLNTQKTLSTHMRPQLIYELFYCIKNYIKIRRPIGILILIQFSIAICKRILQGNIWIHNG